MRSNQRDPEQEEMMNSLHKKDKEPHETDQMMTGGQLETEDPIALGGFSPPSLATPGILKNAT